MKVPTGYGVKDVKCKNGELILILEEVALSHGIPISIPELDVSPKEMSVLKKKYGVKWDGTESSVKMLKGKIIEYPLE